MNRTRNEVTYTQSNPLFDMSLSRSDLYSLQPDGKCYDSECYFFHRNCVEIWKIVICNIYHIRMNVKA